MALVSGILMSTPAMPAQQTPKNEVVVVGNRQAEQVVDRLSRRIAVTTGGQLTKFQTPICPLILGVPDPVAAVIKDELSSNAASVGLKLNKDCRANLTVLFVNGAAAIVEKLPVAPLETRRRELRRSGPSYALAITEIRSRDGDRLLRTANSEELFFLQVRTASMLLRPTRQDINGMVVVIERAAVRGRSLRQVAAFVTMRGLARASDAQIGPGDDTILSLFKPRTAPAPEGLTDFDRAYLRALYQNDGTNAGPIQGSRIMHWIGKDTATRKPGG